MIEKAHKTALFLEITAILCGLRVKSKAYESNGNQLKAWSENNDNHLKAGKYIAKCKPVKHPGTVEIVINIHN